MADEAEFDARYDYHSDYYSINTGAHRKGGIELTTPTLTHHLGLWYSPGSSAALRQRSVERFGPHVDRHVWSVWTSLKRRADLDTNVEFEIVGTNVVCLFGGAYYADPTGPRRSFAITSAASHFALKDAVESDNRILFMKAAWKGLGVVVRCEFHSEYFTITRFVTITDVKTLPKSLDKLPEALALLERLGTDDVDEKATGDSHQFLYHGAWEQLDRDLFDGFDIRSPSPTAVRYSPISAGLSLRETTRRMPLPCRLDRSARGPIEVAPSHQIGP